MPVMGRFCMTGKDGCGLRRLAEDAARMDRDCSHAEPDCASLAHVVPLYPDDCVLADQMLIMFCRPTALGPVIWQIGDLVHGYPVALALINRGLLRPLNDPATFARAARGGSGPTAVQGAGAMSVDDDTILVTVGSLADQMELAMRQPAAGRAGRDAS